MGRITVDKVYTRKKRNLLPIMVNFENGKLAAITKANTSFCRLINKYRMEKFGALVNVNNYMYEGIINDKEVNELTDTYICIRNKHTHNLIVIPVDEVRLKNYALTNVNEISKKAVPQDIATKVLLKQFGNRKASRYMNDTERMKINVQAMEDDLQKTIDNTNIELDENEEFSMDVQYYNTIRPQFNSDTNVLSDIYTINKIIPQELLNNLEEEAKTIYQMKIEEIPIKSSYLLRKITKLKEDVPGVETFLHLKLIVYMDALQNLIMNPKAKSLGKIELSKITEKVEYNIRDNFSDPKCGYKWARTLFSTEKAICYFIVLSLIIENNYQVDWKILSEELHLSRAKILMYAQIVYVLPKTKTSTILTLCLPNTVPTLPKPSCKKRVQKSSAKL